MQRRHVNTRNVSHRAGRGRRRITRFHAGGGFVRDSQAEEAPELVSTSQLHLQQLLVRLAHSADWICTRFIFIRCPSVLPASNIDETHIEYRRLNAPRLTREPEDAAKVNIVTQKSGFSSLFSVKQTRPPRSYRPSLLPWGL